MFKSHPSTHASFRLRWQRFAQSRLHRVLALVAALWVTHGAFAAHRGLALASPPHEAKQMRRTEKPGPAARKKIRSKTASGVTGVLNINAASAKQWQIFPGVGPAIADKILQHRQHKRFRTVADLQGVKGIGPAFLRRFASHLKVSGPTNLERRPRKGS